MICFLDLQTCNRFAAFVQVSSKTVSLLCAWDASSLWMEYCITYYARGLQGYDVVTPIYDWTRRRVGVAFMTLWSVVMV